MSTFVGSENPCDVCADHARRPCWLTPAGARLCLHHYEQVAGHAPLGGHTLPARVRVDVPRAEVEWHQVVPGLRARPAAAVQHGVELQAVRTVRLDDGTHPVADGPAVSIPDAALVELVLMASAHRDSAPANKAFVRMALLCILHGTGMP